MKTKWSVEEIELLKQVYGKFKRQELLTYFPNRTMKSLIYKAFSLKIKADHSITHNSIGFTNHNCFTVPDVYNSYWAGFLAADGCIRKNGFDINLIQKDKNVLYDYAKFLQYNNPKIYSKLKKGVPNAVSYLRVASQQMVKDLKRNFNIVPEKSLTLMPPENLNEKCTLAFITGYIDGDGSISITKKNNFVSCGITGTKDLLSWIASNTDPTLKLYQRKKYENICDPRTYRINVTRKKAERFLKILLSITELDSVRLTRKWNKVNYLKQIRHV